MAINMKRKQTTGIILALITVLTVFFGCKSKEPEFIPDTPEITFSTEEKGATEIFSSEEDSKQAVAQVDGKTTVKAEENGTSGKKEESVKTTVNEKTTSSQKPDNSVETQAKTTVPSTSDSKTTSKKNPETATKTEAGPSTTKKSEASTVTTTKKTDSVTDKGTTKPTVPTTEYTTKKSTATVTPITAKLTYLNDPKNSFIAKLTRKDLGTYSMSENEKSEFLSAREGWGEYTVRIDFTNNDTENSATVYALQVGDNGRNGVFVNVDAGGDLSIAPGKSTYILFNVLVKDGSMVETLVLKEISEREIKVKYAATPDNDTDLPNYKYVTVE